jgi:hypothetical protein
MALDIPQSLASHHGRYACYASHGRHRLHHGDSRTQQRRSWYALAEGQRELDQVHLQTAGCCAWSRDVTSDESAITFEFVGEISSAGTVTESSDIKSRA